MYVNSVVINYDYFCYLFGATFVGRWRVRNIWNKLIGKSDIFSGKRGTIVELDTFSKFKFPDQGVVCWTPRFC